MDRKYAIYLPPGYGTSERTYPVLYLLHGGGGNQTSWVQFGEVQHITDKAISEGGAASMIIVIPDGSAGHREFYNSMDGKWRYEDFFFLSQNHFVPALIETFFMYFFGGGDERARDHAQEALLNLWKTVPSESPIVSGRTVPPAALPTDNTEERRH